MQKPILNVGNYDECKSAAIKFTGGATLKTQDSAHIFPGLFAFIDGATKYKLPVNCGKGRSSSKRMAITSARSGKLYLAKSVTYKSLKPQSVLGEKYHLELQPQAMYKIDETKQKEIGNS